MEKLYKKRIKDIESVSNGETDTDPLKINFVTVDNCSLRGVTFHQNCG